MDKRELLRIAQEVQALNRIRRTCLPILKLPHNLIVQPPGMGKNTSFTNKAEMKKCETTHELVQISPLTINSDMQRGQPPKKRRLLKQVLQQDKKLECREYMEINKVYLNFEQFPKPDNFYRKCIKPHTLPDLKVYLHEQFEDASRIRSNCRPSHSNIEPLPDLCLDSYMYKGKKLFLHQNDTKNGILSTSSSPPKSITFQGSEKLFGFPKNKESNIGNENLKMANRFKFKSGNTISNIYEFDESYSNIRVPSTEKKIKESNVNKISKILMDNDEYNLTINKGGQLEQVKVFVGPTFHRNNTNVYEKLDKLENNEKLDNKTKKRKNDYVNILQPVVVSTKSGTSFEMKPTKPTTLHLKSHENDNMYKHKKKIVSLIAPKL